jgi:hypothetical protein
MAQLSRPYQIALAAIVVLGLVWAVALRSHGSSPSEPAPSSPTASTPAKASSTPSAAGATAGTKGTGAATQIYHGSAPGVEGLTRAIAKAHGAVAASQQNVNRLESKSSELSGEPSKAAGVPSQQGAKSSGATQKSLVATTVANRIRTKAHSRLARHHPGRSVQQVQVEAELAQGKTVMLVFWNPKSSVDREVLAQADALAGGSKGTVTVHAALSSQVGLFGTITEVVHVYQTPTILIVNRRGVVSTLTGLTDVFSLQQAVREARAAKG